MSTTGVKYILANNVGHMAKVLFDSGRAEQYVRALAESHKAQIVNVGEGSKIAFPADERKENFIRNTVIKDLANAFYMPVVAQHMPSINVAYYFSRNGPVNSPTIDNSTTTEVKFSLTDISDSAAHINDQYVHITTRAPQAVVPAALRGGLPPRYRYCPFPGIRLLRRVTFMANENIVSSYTAEHVLWYMQNRLPIASRAAFFECVGQDVGTDAEYYHTDQQFTETIRIKTGYQTFKEDQPGLDLAIPLIFFYNLFTENALQTTNIDVKTIKLVIELEQVSKIVEAIIPYPENDPQGQNIPLTVPSLSVIACDLWSRKIFIEGFIHEIYQNRNFMKAYRDYGIQTTTLTGNGNSLGLTMKHAVESLAVAVQPYANYNSFDNWWIFSYVNEICKYAPIVFTDVLPFDSLGARPFYAKELIPPFKNDWISVSSTDVNGTENMPLVARRYDSYTWSRKSPCSYNSNSQETIREFSWSLNPGREQHSGSISFSKNVDIQYNWIPNEACPVLPGPENPFRLVLMTINFNILNNQNGAMVRNLTT
jgi:hypothetical protein